MIVLLFCILLHQLSSLGFACDCCDKAYNGGMCVDLMSLLLPTLMSALRDGELAKQLSDDALTKLIKQMATLLLDPRIATVGVESDYGISKETREQVQRAVNKTVIQAVISAPTHESAIALLRCQGQFCHDIPPNDDGSNTNTRLSKITTKLMARTVKSESSKATPFDTEKFDMDAFLCSVEDLLVAASKMDQRRSAPCKDTAKIIVSAVVKARSSSGQNTAIRDALDELGYDTDVTLTRKLVESCEKELGLAPTVLSHPPASSNGPADPVISRPFFDIGDAGESSEVANNAEATTATLTGLIADVAAANDKAESVSKLKAFVQSHPDVNIDAHLVPLSAPFRAFILKSLGRSEPPGSGTGAGSPAASSIRQTTSSSPSHSMAERLETIRAKLKDADDAIYPPKASPGASRSAATTASATSDASSSSTAVPSSIRTRMAALNSKREAAAASAVDNKANNRTPRDAASASASSTAALRARLEKLRKNKQGEGA